MDVQALLSHYRESQDAFWQSWSFLCRTYSILRRVNPLLGDGIAVLSGAVGLLAALKAFTLVSEIFSEKYIAALCRFQKGICTILRWVVRQIRNTLKLLLALWRFFKKNFQPQKSETVVSKGVTPEMTERKLLAIETKNLLLEILAADARERKKMRQLFYSADANLRILNCDNCTALVEKVAIETKGTVIKQYARSVLETIDI